MIPPSATSDEADGFAPIFLGIERTSKCSKVKFIYNYDPSSPPTIEGSSIVTCLTGSMTTFFGLRLRIRLTSMVKLLLERGG